MMIYHHGCRTTNIYTLVIGKISTIETYPVKLTIVSAVHRFIPLDAKSGPIPLILSLFERHNETSELPLPRYRIGRREYTNLNFLAYS